MTHTINYNSDSGGIDYQSSKKIADEVEAWDDSETHQFGGFAFDRTNQAMRISLRLSNVDSTNLSDALDNLDSFISGINNNHDASFPAASESADIRPE